MRTAKGDQAQASSTRGFTLWIARSYCVGTSAGTGVYRSLAALHAAYRGLVIRLLVSPTARSDSQGPSGSVAPPLQSVFCYNGLRWGQIPLGSHCKAMPLGLSTMIQRLLVASEWSPRVLPKIHCHGSRCAPGGNRPTEKGRIPVVNGLVQLVMDGPV